MTSWGTARLSCAPPRSVGLRVDQIAHADHALGKDPRAQPAPVDEARHDALLREVLEVLAGLAEPRADQAHRAHPELAIDQVFDRLLVGGALDDLVELDPIVVDEAHASDHDVAGAPALATEDHPVVHGDLAAVLGDDLGLHGGEVAIDLVPEKGDLLTVVELDL